MVRYSRNSVASQKDRRMSAGANPRNLEHPDPRSSDPHAVNARPRSDYMPAHHGLPLQPPGGERVPLQPPGDRVPRPHSADFLEFERSHPVQEQYRVGRGGRRVQPPRPKSSIGEIRKPEDFWSEEMYAQKMRESAVAYDPSGQGSRAQSRAGSRPPLTRSTTALGFTDQTVPQMNLSNLSNENFHPLQLSPTRDPGYSDHQLPSQLPPPPAFYQDTSPRDPLHQPSPRQQYPQPGLYSPNQSFNNSKSPILVQNQSFREDQMLQQNFKHQETPRSTHAHSHVQALPTSPRNQQFPGYGPGYVEPRNQYNHPSHVNNQYTPNHVQYLSNTKPGPTYSPTSPQYTQPSRAQDLSVSQHSDQSANHPFPTMAQNANLLSRMNGNYPPGTVQEHAAASPHPAEVGYTDNEPKLTVPPSLPQPQPRRAPSHTPTLYQNIPTNSRALSDPRPGGAGRLETATPNRFWEDRSPDFQGGDFRRSASARLPKQRTRTGDQTNQTNQQDESDENKKTLEQVHWGLQASRVS